MILKRNIDYLFILVYCLVGGNSGSVTALTYEGIGMFESRPARFTLCKVLHLL